MKVYAVANQKGGVGKSATTLHAGAALAEAGRRVLLIDWDPQGHLTDAIGVPKAGSAPTDPNLPKAVLGKWQGNLSELIHPISDNLYLIPSCDEMFLLEGEMYPQRARERLLTRFLDQLAGVVDDCLIDCPPSLGPLNDAALVAARDRDRDHGNGQQQVTGRIVIPVEAEDSSLTALRLLLRQIATLQDVVGITLTIAGLVVNMYDARRGRIATTTLQAYREHRLPVLGVFGQRKEITEAWRAKQTVIQYAPDSRIATGYRQLVRTLDPTLPALPATSPA